MENHEDGRKASGNLGRLKEPNVAKPDIEAAVPSGGKAVPLPDFDPDEVPQIGDGGQSDPDAENSSLDDLREEIRLLMARVEAIDSVDGDKFPDLGMAEIETETKADPPLAGLPDPPPPLSGEEADLAEHDLDRGKDDTDATDLIGPIELTSIADTDSGLDGPEKSKDPPPVSVAPADLGQSTFDPVSPSDIKEPAFDSVSPSDVKEPAFDPVSPSDTKEPAFDSVSPSDTKEPAFDSIAPTTKEDEGAGSILSDVMDQLRDLLGQVERIEKQISEDAPPGFVTVDLDTNKEVPDDDLSPANISDGSDPKSDEGKQPDVYIQIADLVSKVADLTELVDAIKNPLPELDLDDSYPIVSDFPFIDSDESEPDDETDLGSLLSERSLGDLSLAEGDEQHTLAMARRIADVEYQLSELRDLVDILSENTALKMAGTKSPDRTT